MSQPMQLFKFLTSERPALVEQSIQNFARMISVAEEMFTASTEHLLDNEPLPMDLSMRDEEINELEQSVRRAILEHVSLDPQDELPLSLLLVSIVQDAERCGDLAKTLGKMAALARSPRMGGHTDRLRRVRDRVKSLFPRVREAFLKGDEEEARAVMEEHDGIKGDVTRFLKDLAASDDVTANEAVVLAVSSRMIGRISSHLSNIISTVAMPFDQIRRSPTWGDDE